MDKRKKIEYQEQILELPIAENWFKAIENGQKTLELRPGLPEIITIQKGTRLKFKNRQGHRIRVYIKDIRIYPTWEDVFMSTENLDALYPTEDGKPKVSLEEMRTEAAGQFPTTYEQKKGAYLIEFEYLGND